jgi:hypothetical protein
MSIDDIKLAATLAILSMFDGQGGPDPALQITTPNELVGDLLAWLSDLGFAAYAAGDGVSVEVWTQCPCAEVMAIVNTSPADRTPDMVPFARAVVVPPDPPPEGP